VCVFQDQWSQGNFETKIQSIGYNINIPDDKNIQLQSCTEKNGTETPLPSPHSSIKDEAIQRPKKFSHPWFGGERGLNFPSVIFVQDCTYELLIWGTYLPTRMTTAITSPPLRNNSRGIQKIFFCAPLYRSFVSIDWFHPAWKWGKLKNIVTKLYKPRWKSWRMKLARLQS